MGEFIGVGLDESGGYGGVARYGDYDILEVAGGFECLFVQGSGVLGHRVVSSVDGGYAKL